VPRPVVLLCAFIFCNTFAVGAFPVLLPEMGSDGAISDFALGAIAGAFGLARLGADIPAGLFITHHLRRALVLAAGSIAAGVLCLSLGGPLWSLVLGRTLWGVGHSLAMVGGITAIVRRTQSSAHAVSLNAFEMSGMCGVLVGMVGTGLLPHDWPWNVSLAVASSPQLIGLLLLPFVLSSVPTDHRTGAPRPLFSRSDHREFDAPPGVGRSRVSRLTVLAVASGATIAFAWSAVGQFILPLRASRDFELDRIGVASLVAVPQFVDVLFLLPVGSIADRLSRVKVLGWVLVILAAGVTAVTFGSLPMVIIGCVLVGIGLAAWMLPVSLVNQDAEPSSVAWRTALYRVAVDAGIFLGPVLSGFLLGHSLLGAVGVFVAASLAILGMALLLFPRPRHQAAAASASNRRSL
jgi:MFS family permease